MTRKKIKNKYRDLECEYCIRKQSCHYIRGISDIEEILGYKIECWLRPNMDRSFTGFHDLRIVSLPINETCFENVPIWHHLYDYKRSLTFEEQIKN